MYAGLQVKYLSFLFDFNETLILDKFSNNTCISYCKELHPVGAKLFHAEIRMGGRTDMTQLIVIFHNFENAPKKLKIPSK
jgi:hypothetical protein